jgi:hypothetical protein
MELFKEKELANLWLKKKLRGKGFSAFLATQ